MSLLFGLCFNDLCRVNTSTFSRRQVRVPGVLEPDHWPVQCRSHPPLLVDSSAPVQHLPLPGPRRVPLSPIWSSGMPTLGREQTQPVALVLGSWAGDGEQDVSGGGDGVWANNMQVTGRLEIDV